MNLTPNLEDFTNKIFEVKESGLKNKSDINNRIVYLSYSIEDLINEINSLHDNRFDNLIDSLKIVRENSKSIGIGENTYEVKELKIIRNEIDRLRKIP